MSDRKTARKRHSGPGFVKAGAGPGRAEELEAPALCRDGSKMAFAPGVQLVYRRP